MHPNVSINPQFKNESLNEYNIEDTSNPSERVHKEIWNFAKGIFKGSLAWGLGCATIPLNIITHEWGHAITAKMLINNCIPKMNYLGGALLDTVVSFEGCTIPKMANAGIAAGGPLAEIIAVSAILRYSKSKYTSIALLPHVAHIIFESLSPIYCTRGDYPEILSDGGSAAYALTLAASIIPLALSIHSLKSSFFKPASS